MAPAPTRAAPNLAHQSGQLSGPRQPRYTAGTSSTRGAGLARRRHEPSWTAEPPLTECRQRLRPGGRRDDRWSQPWHDCHVQAHETRGVSQSPENALSRSRVSHQLGSRFDGRTQAAPDKTMGDWLVELDHQVGIMGQVQTVRNVV